MCSIEASLPYLVCSDTPYLSHMAVILSCALCKENFGDTAYFNKDYK